MLRQVDCDPGAIPWIQHTFGDCIYNARDLVGFCAGLASICCWLVAQMPQLYRNYKTQSAEALSAWFLAEWLLGDTCNLLGALLKGDQLPTVVFTAQYFICVDSVMLIQFIYYMSLQRRRERTLAARRHRHAHQARRRRHHHPQAGSAAAGGQQQQQQDQRGTREGRGPCAAAGMVPHEHGDEDGEIEGGSSADCAAAADGSSAMAAAAGRDVSFRPQRTLACLGVLLLVAQLQPGGQLQQQQPLQQMPSHQHSLAAGAAAGAVAEPAGWPHRRRMLQVAGAPLGSGGSGGNMVLSATGWSYTTGTVLGYCSSVLYLTSRVSQIWKNRQRGSAEGLAISMFLCAIAANSLYGASILIRSYNWEELRSSLPWLIGSLGTVALDLTIAVQSRVLGREDGGKHHPSDEEEPLLQP